jgi:flavorubredoxin
MMLQLTRYVILLIPNVKDDNMQILILYHRKGGNTRRPAEAIAEGVNQVVDVEAVVRSTEDVSKYLKRAGHG